MKLVVFTDLDATLLDSETYSWEPARESLAVLRAREAVVVLVSSKTFAEMEPLHRELELQDPFIVENGGGIFIRRESPVLSHISKSRYPIWQHGDYACITLGTDYETLVQSLVEISQCLGIRLVGFSAMSDREVAALTGLDLKDAARARTRLFDEPFIIRGEKIDAEAAVQRAAAAKGLTAVQGGRFGHLIGHPGKGSAAAMLIDAYRSMYGNVLTIGLGDSPNDFPFLELVDRPVLVGAAGKPLDLPEAIRDARRTESPGPRGWNEAVLDILNEITAEDR
ncbi:MAG: HAD-IIB family hydrolase [Desulfomonilaceae bacterium]|nr:HAD-IIB family hydrolase [Desulfomonilaceae bacterium]